MNAPARNLAPYAGSDGTSSRAFPVSRSHAAVPAVVASYDRAVAADAIIRDEWERGTPVHSIVWRLRNEVAGMDSVTPMSVIGKAAALGLRRPWR